MSTVYLQLKTGDSVDKILELLQEVENQVLDEQSRHDISHNEFQGHCEVDKQQYRDDISQAEADKAKYEDLLEKARQTKTKLERRIQNHESVLADTKAKLADAKELIDTQREEFKRQSEELVDAISIFNNAKTALTEAFRSGSFLQTASGATFANQLKSAKLNARFAPFARILAQAATSNKLSQSAIDQILALLDRLIQNAQSTLSSERQVMQEREDAFTALETSLNATIKKHEKALEGLQAQLKIVNSNIAVWEPALADAEWRLENATEKLAERTKECDDENTHYVKQTEQR